MTRKELMADANRRIAACSDREFWIGAVLYLGIKPEIAREIRRVALKQPKSRDS